MKVICVTGSSGYIGQLLVECLERHSGCEKIIGISRRRPVKFSQKLKFYQIDIRNKSIREVFKKEKIDTLVHLAYTIKASHDINEMHDINVNGTLNILDIAKENNIKKIVIVSSTTVYGAHSDNPVYLTEDVPLKGNSNYYYTKDKIEIEQIFKKFKKENPQIKCIVIRPCTLLGPHANNHISRYMMRPIVPIIYGCNPEFQIIHEEDLINALRLVLEKDVDGVFNIVGKDAIPLRDIPKILNRKSIGIPYKLFYIIYNMLWLLRIPILEHPVPMLHFIRYRWVASGDKAKRELGYFPRYSAREALLDFAKAKSKLLLC